jgi:hypothetical protein
MKFPGWPAESLLSWAKVRLNEEKLSPASKKKTLAGKILGWKWRDFLLRAKDLFSRAMRASKAKKTPQRENYLIR